MKRTIQLFVLVMAISLTGNVFAQKAIKLGHFNSSELIKRNLVLQPGQACPLQEMSTNDGVRTPSHGSQRTSLVQFHSALSGDTRVNLGSAIAVKIKQSFRVLLAPVHIAACNKKFIIGS